MLELHPLYQVDDQGRRIAVVLDIREYEQLLAELQELRERSELSAEMDAWDKASDEALVLYEQALN